jgi:hypothetical protein
LVITGFILTLFAVSKRYQTSVMYRLNIIEKIMIKDYSFSSRESIGNLVANNKWNIFRIYNDASLKHFGMVSPTFPCPHQ